MTARHCTKTTVVAVPQAPAALSRVTCGPRGPYPCDFAGVVPNRLVAVRTPHR